MSEQPIELNLKRDQIFGLHACVPGALVDEVCELLDNADLDFTQTWTGAERLAEPGCTTVMFFDSPDLVQRGLKRSAAGRLRLAEKIETLPPRITGSMEPLLQIGRPGTPAEAPEYCAEWGFTMEDVPALTAVMSDAELHDAPSTTKAVWAPVHALRALGWLRAESAVGAMVAEWGRLEQLDDDYLGDEIAWALGFVGPAALDSVVTVLADAGRKAGVRLHAAHALARIANRHPDARAACIDALVKQLAAHLVQDREFNGFLISALLDARAVEAEPEMARAFASGRVAESIAGDLEDVQIELGLKDRRAEERWNPLQSPYRAPSKVGRNEPCPCGSGKKYKKCCGQ